MKFKRNIVKQELKFPESNRTAQQVRLLKDVLALKERVNTDKTIPMRLGFYKALLIVWADATSKASEKAQNRLNEY